MKYLKTLGCLLALLIAAVILFPATAKAADVEINATNFPDAKFRKYVKQFDKNDDGKLSKAEAEEVYTIDVKDLGITTMKGVGNFTSCSRLNCSGNSLSTLDVSKLTQLESLDCADCGLTKLTFAAPEMRFLICNGNNLSSVDISPSKKLVICKIWPEWVEDSEDGKSIDYYCEFDTAEDPNDESIEIYELVLDKATTISIKKPVIYSEWGTKRVAIGKKAELHAQTEGDGTLKFQWYYKKSASGSWTEVSSSAGKKEYYTFTVAERHYGYTYRCKVSNSNGEAYSKEFQIQPPIVIKTQPKDTSRKGEGKITVKVVAEGEELKYTWWVKDPGDTKFFKSSVKTASYSQTFTVAKGNNGRQAYCVITDEEGNTLTTKTVTMSFVTAKPKITSPTKATTKKVAKGKTATFTVKTTILEKAGKTYQWQYRTSSTGTWKNVSAASGKTASYKLTVAKKHNGYQYRCKVTNAYGTTISKIFTLKVTS